MLTCYADVGGSLSEVVLSPAILVSSPEKWQSFEISWNECLAEFGVSALHMRHFAHSRGEFKHWDLDEPKRRRFLKWLMQITEETVEFSAAVSIYVSDYERVNKLYQLSESVRPYTLGCLSCAARIMPWCAAQQHNRDDITWIFEKGDLDQHDLTKRWEIAYPDNHVKPVFLRKIDDSGTRIRPFEAADLIGYENLLAHRLIQKKAGTQIFEDLRKPMQRLSQSLRGADLWGYLGEDEMIALCERSKILPR